MAADDLVVRQATPDDDLGIRALFGACFPDSPKVDQAIVDWQYWNNPFAEVRSWVAVDGSQIVAHYAGMPVPAWIDGRRSVAAIGIDAATASSHRGRGLFERLARAVYEDCGRHGMAVTLCFPNQNSLRGFVKAGGTPLGRLETFVLALDAAWVASRFRIPAPAVAPALTAAFRRPAPGDAREVEGPPAGLDELWDRRPAYTENGVERDAAWWDWRYRAKPGADYRYYEVRRGDTLLAAGVTTEREAFGGRFTFVLELLGATDDAARAVVGAMAHAAVGTAGLATVAMAGSAMATRARAAGLRRLPHRLEPKPLNVGIVDNDGIRPHLSGQRWTVSWGDLDHL